MKRTKKDPTAWRSTPAGDTAWRACREPAMSCAAKWSCAKTSLGANRATGRLRVNPKKSNRLYLTLT